MEKGKYRDRADVDEPGAATSSFAIEMSTSAVRSVLTYEEEVAALEAELEAWGFLCFKDVSPTSQPVLPSMAQPATPLPTPSA